MVHHTVVSQFILLDTLDHLRVDRAAENLMDTVEKAAHAQAMGGKLAVTGHDQHLRTRNIRCEQPGGHAAGLDHILSNMVQPAALPHVRIAGDHRHAALHQPVDLLAHGHGIGCGHNQPVDAALLQPPDRLKIGTV